MNYKVLITTSGIGSRLKELTKDTNKALVEINGKATLSYVIGAYPKEVPIVVTLGYYGDHVQKFLEENYPDRKFEFVTIDNYAGEGSSLGYSMLQTKDNLQCPFVFHACDTIVVEKIPAPDQNWIAGYVADKDTTDLQWEQYRTHKVEEGKVLRLNDKGDPDFESIHIGLTGVKDYADFWSTLESLYNSDPSSSGWSDVHVVNTMIQNGNKFEWIPYKVWLDTGNMEALKKAGDYLANN
ncbi:hypothetical protein GOV14_01020 [Candidatus Pacearchaeota archaeon]|nr:hypothetical protein [Candidatus Pacearchaeota archaeon]